jgi:hypothetical protein
MTVQRKSCGDGLPPTCGSQPGGAPLAREEAGTAATASAAKTLLPETP